MNTFIIMYIDSRGDRCFGYPVGRNYRDAVNRLWRETGGFDDRTALNVSNWTTDDLNQLK
jgi:hypothetical protein